MVDLSVRLGRLALKNPVLVASGTFGYVREMAGFVDVARLGGVIPKTVTARPRAGNPTPRTVETPAGLLNAIGLDNDGIDHFRAHHLPYLRTVGTAVIVNVAGEDEDQFVALAEAVGAELVLGNLPDAVVDGWVRESAEAAAARGIVGIVDFEMTWNRDVWLRRVAGGFDAFRVDSGVYPQDLDRAIAAGMRTGLDVAGGAGLLRVG